MGTDMSEIPEDIAKVASTIASGFFAAQTVAHAFLAGAIERAIHAERDRCALLAENCDSFPFEGDHIGKLIRSE